MKNVRTPTNRPDVPCLCFPLHNSVCGNDAVTYAHRLVGKFFLRFFTDRKEGHKIVDAVFYRCDVFRHLRSVYKTIVGAVGIARNL